MNKTAQMIPVYSSPTESADSVGASIVWRAVTHRGLVRLHNEDAFYAGSKANCNLFAIADGLGGHRGGAVASRVAIDAIRSEFEKWNGKGMSRLVSEAIISANQEVFNEAQWYPGLSKMQTTATLAAFEGNSLLIAHVGDCRFYRLREGRLTLLTRDHTVASDFLRLRLISPSGIAEHPGRHQLTRSVGSSLFVRTDIIKGKINSRDSYLLCSDGVWSNLSSDDIKDALLKNEIDKSMERLIEIPLDSGALDNITAIVIRIK